MALIINFNLVGKEDETFYLAERIHEALSGSRCYIDSEVCFNFGNYQDELCYSEDHHCFLRGRQASLIIGNNNDYDQTITVPCYLGNFVGQETDDEWLYFGNLNENTKIYTHKTVHGLTKYTDKYGKTEYTYHDNEGNQMI